MTTKNTDTPIYDLVFNAFIDQAATNSDDALFQTIDEMDTNTRPKKIASRTKKRQTISVDGRPELTRRITN